MEVNSLKAWPGHYIGIAKQAKPVLSGKIVASAAETPEVM